jgi:hypothetical protein
MNRGAVIEMAREAISEEPYAEVALPFESTIWMMDIVQLERFAALIAGHEREACAKVCMGAGPDARACAAAIRARGKQ